MRTSFVNTSFIAADQLIEYLNPLDTQRWPPGEYLFRGQADANDELVPSAQRRDGPLVARGYHGDPDVTCGQQVEFEQLLFNQFLEACDRAGLQVPGDSELMRKLAKHDSFIEQPLSWPPVEIHTALAFAQHHGVPTCLLDWSRRAHVALYFAASSSLSDSARLNPNRPSKHLAIWVLRRPPHQGSIVEAPGSASPNLAAQSGLFTVSSVWGDKDEVFVPQRLESGFDGEGCLDVTKITLPDSYAVDLLKACTLLGVSGSTLFPGYEGIARSVRDWANVERKHYDPDAIATRDFFS